MTNILPHNIPLQCHIGRRANKNKKANHWCICFYINARSIHIGSRTNRRNIFLYRNVNFPTTLAIQSKFGIL